MRRVNVSLGACLKSQKRRFESMNTRCHMTQTGPSLPHPRTERPPRRQRRRSGTNISSIQRHQNRRQDERKHRKPKRNPVEHIVRRVPVSTPPVQLVRKSQEEAEHHAGGEAPAKAANEQRKPRRCGLVRVALEFPSQHGDPIQRCPGKLHGEGDEADPGMDGFQGRRDFVDGRPEWWLCAVSVFFSFVRI